jgi:GNAT superfamily N-acetyltransferase
MSEFTFRKLTTEDVDAFIEMRIQQLLEEGSEGTVDLTPALHDYYDKHLGDGTFISWLAIDNGRIVATSGISFIEKPPYYGNTSGMIGLLSSMYTLKEYRRKGIATALLDRVMNEAKLYGCSVVQITASDMGVLLYKNYGFKKNENFMQYKFDNCVYSSL